MSIGRISALVFTSLVLLVSGVGSALSSNGNLPAIETLKSAAIESENEHSVSQNSVTSDMTEYLRMRRSTPPCHPCKNEDPEITICYEIQSRYSLCKTLFSDSLMMGGASVSHCDKRTGDSSNSELAGLFITILPHAQLDYPPHFEKCSFPAVFQEFSREKITWSVTDSDSSLENHSPGKPYSRYLLPLLLTFAAAGVTYALFVVRSH